MAETTEDQPVRTVCVDLDGVLNVYDGWEGENYFHGPRPGVADFLLNLGTIFDEVLVHTTRDVGKTTRWLEGHNLRSLVDGVTSDKPPAIAYVDDRAVQFNGDFEQTLEDLRGFAPHWKETNAGDAT